MKGGKNKDKATKIENDSDSQKSKAHLKVEVIIYWIELMMFSRKIG